MSGQEKPPLGWNSGCHSRSSSMTSFKNSRQSIKDWEVVEDVEPESTQSGEPLQNSTVPGVCEGFLMKKRKWPLKGWHKRYFVLDDGILCYSRTQQDIAKGKLHGSLDVSLAVMSINRKSKRIDLDAGDSLCHLKTKSDDVFHMWVTKLRGHRMYRKSEAVHVHTGFVQACSHSISGLPGGFAQWNGGVGDMRHTVHYQYDSKPMLEDLRPMGSDVNEKVSAWLQHTEDTYCCSQELNRCRADLIELNQLVEKLCSLEDSQPSTNGDLQQFVNIQNLSLERLKKCGRMRSHSRPVPRVESLRRFSSSHLNTTSCPDTPVPSIPNYVYSTNVTTPEEKHIQRDICSVSHRVYTSLKSVCESLAQDCQRLEQALTGPDFRRSTSQQLAPFCTALSESCLLKVHSLSLSSDSTEKSFCTVHTEKIVPSVSRRWGSIGMLSVADSTYYDASDNILCGNSKNDASDESVLSDASSTNSELEKCCTATQDYLLCGVSSAADLPRAPLTNTGHRSTLPAPCPDNSHIGLMAILYSNIGKDLSRVSMPVPLNEPLGLLQRLCEELEYSELLDRANHTEDPYHRMLYIAAFAISGYATAHYRNRYKPFNPVLGETFECERKDKGFHFISEQVSHHPPVSACHADSKNFSFWQDQRWKNKFWGKSLEVIPTGMVNVTLPRFGDHYEWNKVVTCIHNVLSPQRYLEHYGEVIIRNINSVICTCKINFLKSCYWGSDAKINEVQGVVLDQAGTVVHHFGGFWHEGIFCDTLPITQCLWKPNPQPKEHFLYYGFSSFAMELNELTPELKTLIPPTDTRLRPDQRMLEEGKINEANKRKDEVEEKQREMRKILAKKGVEHVPRFFRISLDVSGREVWLTNGSYWKIRENPGFSQTDNPDLW